VVVSNCTTTSPGLTTEPFFASSMICRSPPPDIGAVSSVECAGRISPRSCR
jgi:hypothetical protein